MTEKRRRTMRTEEEIQDAIGEGLPALIKWVVDSVDVRDAVESALDAIEQGGLSWARLNQLMHLCSEAGMSEGFYRYYFLVVPQHHPYPVEKVFPEGHYNLPDGVGQIKSLQQLQWGIRRFMYDTMIYWGNFRQAYRELRQKTVDEIENLFREKCVNEGRLIRRGKVVGPVDIPRDNRYLISEMACKTYDKRDNLSDCEHVKLALQAFRKLKAEGAPITPDNLRSKTKGLADKTGQLLLFELLFEKPDTAISTEEEVIALYSGQHDAFLRACKNALNNTRTYLSICNDLDVYVATSMRTRDDFREMAKACEIIFRNNRLKKYNIRYFDPTLSAANYHEDKGIIECLMVKNSKGSTLLCAT